MDVQTGLICVGLIVVSAAAILLISMFGIKEKTYEEAIAEQRKLPDDLLLGESLGTKLASSLCTGNLVVYIHHYSNSHQVKERRERKRSTKIRLGKK